MTIRIAHTLADALPEDYEFQARVMDAFQKHESKITLPKNYKGILNELKTN